jgi:hypothetical protein
VSRTARAMRRAALALGISVSLALPIEAAEWSFAPTLSLAADYDSNRNLLPQAVASQSTSLAGSAELRRATETTQLSFSPQLHWQLFDKKAYDDIFERDLEGSASWTGERADASLSAEDADQSTLRTELTQTGVLSSNLHQRLDQVTLLGSYSHSERYTTIAQLGYSNVSYYGTNEGALLDLLQGYRYPTALLGERYRLSDQENLTASAYRNELLARLSGENTYTTGFQLEYERTFSERNHVDAGIGAARVQGQTGTQTLTTASLSASRTYSLGTLAFAYSRALVPYGTAVIVERQQATLSATRGLTEKVQLFASANWVRNGEPIGQSQAGSTIVQVQTYESAQLGLNWQPAETWKFAAELDATRSRTVELVSHPVHSWRAAVSVIWTPHRIARSF